MIDFEHVVVTNHAVEKAKERHERFRDLSDRDARELIESEVRLGIKRKHVFKHKPKAFKLGRGGVPSPGQRVVALNDSDEGWIVSVNYPNVFVVTSLSRTR